MQRIVGRPHKLNRKAYILAVAILIGLMAIWVVNRRIEPTRNYLKQISLVYSDDIFPDIPELKAAPEMELLVDVLHGDNKYHKITITNPIEIGRVVEELSKNKTCEDHDQEHIDCGFICFETNPPHGAALHIIKMAKDNRIVVEWGNKYYNLDEPDKFISVIKAIYDKYGEIVQFNREYKNLFYGITKIEYRDLDSQEAGVFDIVVTDQEDIKEITDAIAESEQHACDRKEFKTCMILHKGNERIELEQGFACFNVLQNNKILFRGYTTELWAILNKHEKAKYDKDEIDKGADLEDVNTIFGFKSAWTNNELIIWNGKQGYSFDYQKETWRRIARNPNVYKGNLSPGLAHYKGSKAIAVYWKEEHGLCLDIYDTIEDKWSTILRIPRSAFIAPNDLNPRQNPSIVSIEKTSDETIIFLCGASSHSKVIGIRVNEQTEYKFTPIQNAPSAPCYDAVSYHKDDRLLFWGYSHVVANEWSVLNLKDNTWMVPITVSPNYSYGHCFSGDNVYIFGGAYSSAYGWINEGGWEYSFENNEWKTMPGTGVPPGEWGYSIQTNEWSFPGSGAPRGRRDFAMHWTGENVIIWGGDIRTNVINDGALFDPASNQWKNITHVQAPSPRSHVISVWTGKEMLVFGGYQSTDAHLFDLHAYDPKGDKWRALPGLK
jgi:hypothetical protein